MDKRALEAFCDEWFDAWRGNDPGRLSSFYAEDCWYVDPARPEGLRGRAQLRRYFERLLAANPDWTWTRQRLDPVEGGFSVTYLAQVPVPGGEPLTIRGMDLVLLRGREIVANEVHFDTALWLHRLGRTPRG